MSDLGIGVVGCGLIGTRHGMLFDSLDGVSLRAVCDVDGERAEAAASQLGVKAYSSVDEMVLDDSIDAVSVATSGSHGGPAETAARAGKHVLVETSFAATLQECDRIIDAGERSGVNVMYCATHRFYPFNVKARELVDAGEVGKVVWMTREFIRQGRPGDTAWARWRATGGGFFMRSGAIMIDHTRWMAGSEIEEVYAIGMGTHVGGGDGEDNGMAGFRFKNGVFASLLGASAAPGVTDSWWRLGGDKGLVEYSDLTGLRLGKDGWTDVPFEGRDTEAPPRFPGRQRPGLNGAGWIGWKAEFEEFVASIREGRQPAVTGHDGRACTEAAIAIVMSHETGKPVRLPLG